MNDSTLRPHGAQPAGGVTLGSGWQWPAAFVAIFVGLFYMPAHQPSAGVTDGLIAVVAALYVVGMSVIGARLSRGVILRAGGSREPVVLLGGGPDALTSDSLRPRWRLAAIAAGTILPLAAAVTAGRVAAGADTATYAHAIASLALGVNFALAAGVLVPAPGFTGWAVLLGLVDATGARPDRRIQRAARVAEMFGVPFLLTGGAAAALLGDPMLMILGFLLGYFTWTQSRLAVAQDAIVRFLGVHVAGEVARPMTSHAEPDEAVDDLLARLRTDRTVSLVEANGGILGAIGPRQLVARGVVKRDDRCADLMVPLGSIRLLGPSSATVELFPEIARHGFALVTGPDGLGYVEAADLGRQVRIWVALAERRERRSTDGPAGPDRVDGAGGGRAVHDR